MWEQEYKELDSRLSNIHSGTRANESSTASYNRSTADLRAQASRSAAEVDNLNLNLSSLTAELTNSERVLNNLYVSQASLESKIAEEENLLAEITGILNNFSAVNNRKLNTATLLVETLSPEDIARSEAAKEAVTTQSIESFDKVLEKVTNLNFRDAEGKTMLMHAIINGFYYGVEKLLAAGADVNLSDNNGNSTLIYAAAFPHLKYLKKIAELTENINCSDSFGNTPMHLVVRATNNKVFSDELPQLTERGGDLYFTGTLLINESLTISSNVFGEVREDGYNCNQEKTLKAIEILTALGGNVNAQNKQGSTPLHFATLMKLKYLVNQLIDKVDLSITDNTGQGSLSIVAEMRDNALLEKLLDKGLDINHRDEVGRSLLFWIAYYGWQDMLTFLLNHHADSDIPNNAGFYPLHAAAALGHLGIVQALAPLSGVDKLSDGAIAVTPYYFAARNNRAEVKTFLLNSGANPDNIKYKLPSPQRPVVAPSLDAYDILEKITTGRVAEALDLLDENNVNLQTVFPLAFMSNCGLTPLTALCALGHAVAGNGKVLLANVLNAAWEKMLKFEAVKYDIVDTNGCTYLQWAVWSGSTELVKKVAEHLPDVQGDVNKTDAGGRTAVDIAFLPHVANVALDTVIILAKSGANVEKTADGNSVIGKLCLPVYKLKQKILATQDAGERSVLLSDLENLQQATAEAIKVLISLGKLKPAIKDTGGFTAIHWLAELSQFEDIISRFDQEEVKKLTNMGDAQGKSPLHWYCDYNAPKTVEILRKYGANVNLQDKNKDTAGHLLMLNPSKVNIDKPKLPVLKQLSDKENKPPLNPYLKNGANKFISDLIKESDDSPDKSACLTEIQNYENWYHETQLSGAAEAVHDLWS